MLCYQDDCSMCDSYKTRVVARYDGWLQNDSLAFNKFNNNIGTDTVLNHATVLQHLDIRSFL